MRYLIFAIVFLSGCAGKKCCPPVVPERQFMPPPNFVPAPPPKFIPPPPPLAPPVLFPQETFVPPIKARVEKCFKFIVSENYPYDQGPDLRWEMSWKW